MKIDLTDKTILITGGSSGIGAAAAMALRKLNANLIITGRSAETKKLADELDCDYFLVDYNKFSSVRKFAQDLLNNYQRIDVLVNNVGGIIGERRITEDGHEMTLQVNHLSGFLLTQLLQERLEESKAIVINTSSVANNQGKIDFEDIQHEKSYKAFKVYGAVKQMNILHAMEISRRYNHVKAASFHPGIVITEFAREGNFFMKLFYKFPLRHLYMITPEKGADTMVWLITHPDQWKAGEYYDKRKPGRKNPQVSDSVAYKLWEVSEVLTSSENE
jgi:NAD(P)-dependent dehydrogenase (short-subunit alcohol dehydrogenase family)